ncbi:MAG: hypothetical protein Q9174_002400 [Haloplaca sp. 1 TL-2023]
MEETSPKHQFLPLSPLPSIAELPKQESPPETQSSSKETVPAHGASLPNQGARLESSVDPESQEPGPMNTTQAEVSAAKQHSESANVPSDHKETSAANVPLPDSPGADDSQRFPEKFPSEAEDASKPRSNSVAADIQDTTPTPARNIEETDTWTSKLASILPRSTFNQPTRQNTAGSNIASSNRASRSASVAPGAYPESESAGESLVETPNAVTESSEVENGLSSSTVPRSDEKSIRPKKSVTIALPDTKNDNGAYNDTRKDGTDAEEGTNSKKPSSISQSGSEANVEGERTKEEAEASGEAPRGSLEASTVSRNPIEQQDEDSSADHLQPLAPRDASLRTRASSIAASQEGSDRTDFFLRDKESLAPTETDNSSLSPLLASPKRRRSSHFSESLGDTISAPMATGSGQAVEAKWENTATPDKSSSRSTSVSSSASDAAKADKGKSSGKEAGESSSRRASTLPPPKITVKEASEAEDSPHTPSLAAPTTTPVQSESLPQRKATFAALGELSPGQLPAKLPVKRRKLYVRKARSAILRQPILDAALGRQVGGQAKVALKKLANGELIVVEPPTSL